VSGDGGDDANLIRDLAYDALKAQLKSAGSSEVARSEGIKLGAQLASEAAAENRSAEIWDKVTGRLEGMLNTFLDRMDANELRKAAADSPPPTEDEADQAEGTDLDAKAVLDAIGKRPPPEKAAELLKGAGVTAANLEDVLSHVRSAGQGWPAFLDQKPDWLNAVRVALGAPVVDAPAADDAPAAE
jgi:hypothetical protein